MRLFTEPKKITYASTDSNLQFIEFPSDDTIRLTGRDGQTASFTTKGRSAYNSGTGEGVIELSGKVTDGKEDRSWAIVYLDKDGYSPYHHHNERTEKYYITSGTAKFVVDKTEHILTAGDFIMINPKQKHQITNIGDDANLSLIVECYPAWIPEDAHVDEPEASVIPQAK